MKRKIITVIKTTVVVWPRFFGTYLPSPKLFKRQFIDFGDFLTATPAIPKEPHFLAYVSD